MAKSDLVVRSAVLATKEKLPEGFLFAGKIEDDDSKAGFLFYVIEILSPWIASSKVKRAIVSILEKNFSANENVEEGFFENVLQQINSSLNNLVNNGTKEWLGNLNAVIGFVCGNEISAAQTGNISGYIFRKNKISAIIENQKSSSIPHPLKTFADVTYGQLIPDDKIVFGNMELYNHLSLDRIRRLVENGSANEAIFELFKILKRSKVLAVNTIIIEAKNVFDLENEAVIQIQDVIYLDQSSDNFAKTIKKYAIPVAKAIVKYCKLAFYFTIKNGNKYYKISREKWGKSWSPSSKKILKKSGRSLSKVFGEASQSVKPGLAKLIEKNQYKNLHIKTRDYSKKTDSIIRNLFKNILAILLFCIKTFSVRKNRKYLYLSLLVLVFFVGYFKVRSNNIHRNELKQKMEISDSYDRAKELYNKAKENSALGKTSDESELTQSLELAQKAEQSPNTKDDAAVLVKQIQNTIDGITKTNRIFNPAPLFSFNNPVAKITFSGTDIFGITSDGKIYTGNTQDKESKLAASIGKENGNVVDLTYFDALSKILIFTDNKKMITYDPVGKATSELSINDQSGKWEDAVSIATFSTSVYLLDSEAGETWRHSQLDNGYSKGSSALNTSDASIRGATSIAIDGSVYVLKNTSQVVKFTRGAPDDFTLKNMPNSYNSGTPAKIYTDENINYLFILDKKSNKIVRFDKSGEFISQYILDGVAINDFVVNGKIQKLWAVSAGKVYEINL